MLYEFINAFLLFIERGGFVLKVILLLSIVMWTFLLERFWYIFITYPRHRAQLTGGIEQLSFFKRLVMVRHLNDRLPIINSLVYVLPLLGLFGTVVGMIQTFDVIAVFGSTNPRGLSAGISQALLTTMAGLVTSISGLFLAEYLSRRVNAISSTLIRQEEVVSPLAVSSVLRLRYFLIAKAARQHGGD